MAVGVSNPKLVAAVCNAGAVGTLAASGLKPGELRAWIRETRELTDNPFGVNLMIALYDFSELLQVCIDESVCFVALGAGFSRDAIRKLKEVRINSFTIVSSAKAAKLSIKAGTWGIIIEAPDKAGGHLGIQEKDPEKIVEHMNVSVWNLLEEIIPLSRKELDFYGPIIAAGGIKDGRDILRALDMGASGIQLGTRFAMSLESGASDLVKRAWVEAKDTKVIVSPVGLPGRVIEDQKTGQLPTVQDIERCVRCLSHCGKEYCIFDALKNATTPNIEKEKILIFAGSSVSEYSDIISVEQIVRNLQEEYREAVIESEQQNT